MGALVTQTDVLTSNVLPDGRFVTVESEDYGRVRVVLHHRANSYRGERTEESVPMTLDWLSRVLSWSFDKSDPVWPPDSVRSVSLLPTGEIGLSFVYPIMGDGLHLFRATYSPRRRRWSMRETGVLRD